MSLQIAISNAIRGFNAGGTPPVPLTSLMISGTFTSPGTRLYSISNDDNTPNSTFNSNTSSGINNYVWNGTLYGDKVLLGGFWTTWNGNGSPYQYFIELNKNGSVSRTALGTGFNSSVRCFVVQPDNKIIVAGTFTDYNGVNYNRIMRLNADFTIDATFNPGTGFPSGEVNRMITDGTSLYCAGNFTSYNGTTRNRFVKIRMSDGADVTGSNTGFNNVIFGLVLLGDYLLVGGEGITTFNGLPIPNNICKIHKDTFAIDSTFSTNIGSGANGRVSYNLQADSNYVYLYGNFGIINGVAKPYCAKITHDGIVSTTFPNVSWNQNILYINLIDNNSKLAVAGTFSNVNGNAGYNKFCVIDVNTEVALNQYAVNFTPGAGTFAIEF